ncbi:MAG: hypothetical protein DWP95_04995 [Proteobacteria bacterium]|nr:MAG: hypothetical protein DWP95_04995 [Pseudomonadota bacterium]
MFGPVADSGLSQLWLGLTAVLICMGIWRSYRARKSAVVYLLGFNVVIILMALLTQFNTTDISGGGARVLYIMTPWLVTAICLAWLYDKTVIFRSMLLGYFVLTAILHHKILAQWSTAASVSNEIVDAVPGAIKEIADDDWALLLVPEYIGAALLARNAQGAMVSPPFQNKPYLDTLVPFIWRDLELWRERANSAFVKQFKSNSNQPNEQPLYAFCVAVQGGFVQQEISRDAFKSQQVWQAFWQNLIKQNNCYQ